MLNHEFVVANQQELRQLLTKTQSLHADRIILGQKRSSTTYQMAVKLSEVRRTQAAERIMGLSFKSWVSTLKDEHGRDRTWGWARALISLLKKIEFHPLLQEILNRQIPDDAAGFIDFSSAYQVARLSEEDTWTMKIAGKLKSEGCLPGDWEEEKRNRLITLYYKWGTQSVSIIKDRIREVRGDKEDSLTPNSWPWVSGKVDPDVKEMYDEAFIRLAKILRPGEIAEGMSLTKEMETMGQGVTDLLDIIEDVSNGKTGKLEAWLDSNP